MAAKCLRDGGCEPKRTAEKMTINAAGIPAFTVLSALLWSLTAYLMTRSGAFWTAP